MKKYFLVGVLLLFLTVGCGNKKSSSNVETKVKEPEVDTITENYVAYVKINPSLKLEYSQTCNQVDGKKESCEEPIVSSYTPVNEDAKEMFKDVDLLDGEKDLASVLNKIYTKE